MKTPPLWSVMIPTWNRTEYLDECLQSVIPQRLQDGRMEILVRDNASDRVDIETTVRSIAGSSEIAFERNSENVGFVNNANLCIADAHGELTHLLSDDDYVFPGFYEHIEVLAQRHPTASAFAVGCIVVDQAGHVTRRIKLPDGYLQGEEGIKRMLNGNPFQMPGVVVRKTFYEQNGGFDPELLFNADWDMWIRAAAQGGIVTSSRILAAYRVHGNNDTARLSSNSQALRNTVLFFKRLKKRYPRTDWFPFQNFLLVFAQDQLGKLSRNWAILEYFRGLIHVLPSLRARATICLLHGEAIRVVRFARGTTTP